MKAKHGFAALLVLASAALSAVAQPDARVLPFPNAVELLQPDGKVKDQPKDKDKDKKIPEKKITDPPVTDAFAGTLFPRSDLPTGFNPHMMGDFQGYFARVSVNVLGTQTTTTTATIRNGGVPPTSSTVTTTTTTPVSQSRTILVPVPGLGGFKIADNASPMPQDRVFFTYNYFGHVRGPQESTAPIDVTQSIAQSLPGRQGPGATANTTINTFIPGAPQTTANLHRELFGFEKTFLDGNASIELRVPFVQQSASDEAFRASHIGDLTIIAKYAFFLNRETGDVFSAGLAVTAPTGPGIDTIDGTLHSTLLQPWFGYIWNRDRFFLHAFHSVVIPTDSRDVTLLFNDVGVNYWLYRGSPDRPLNFIVPMIEAHVTTPLNHRSGDAAVFVPDMVVLTGGVHLGVFRNGTLSVGAATPVTGPRPFNIEAFVQLNWRY
jgi:hypothetical protein